MTPAATLLTPPFPGGVFLRNLDRMDEMKKDVQDERKGTLEFDYRPLL